MTTSLGSIQDGGPAFQSNFAASISRPIVFPLERTAASGFDGELTSPSAISLIVNYFYYYSY